MSTLSFHDLFLLSRDRHLPDLSQMADVLEKAREEAISFTEINLLLNGVYSPQYPLLRERLLDFSSRLRLKTFGNWVVPMAPVEASNCCASDCLFCGWRSSNAVMARMRLSESLIMEQVKYLVGKGMNAARMNVRPAGGQAGAGQQNRRIDIIWVPQGATY